MQEKFLHFLWRFRRFSQKNLTTSQGESLVIEKIGAYNHHAGPDFNNARIRIGDTLWAGNVEMHLKASDWNVHQHQKDKAYDNVILHVVLEEDEPIYRTDGERIPCLELKSKIPSKLSRTYLKIWNSTHWIPCESYFNNVSELNRTIWLDRLLVERLEYKTQAIHKELEQQKYDWENVFYQFLARNFGVKVNTEPFELLAKSLPLNIIQKHKDSLFQIEALLFGQSGLLDGIFQDEYPQKLQKEYQFLQKKYGLIALKKESWKFLRMRPPNFPTVRIAQLAILLFQSNHLFSKMLTANNGTEIENILEVQLSNYWQTHYIFDKESIKRKKSLGTNAINLITINTIVPFLFLYGKIKKIDNYTERAIRILEELPAEKNNIMKGWDKLNLSPFSAYDSQALLHLKTKYCDAKKCLDCNIGNLILR